MKLTIRLAPLFVLLLLLKTLPGQNRGYFRVYLNEGLQKTYTVGHTDTLYYLLENDSYIDITAALAVFGDGIVPDSASRHIKSRSFVTGYCFITPSQNVVLPYMLVAVPERYIGPDVGVAMINVHTGIPYYDPTNNLHEDSLKQALAQLLNSAGTLTYNEARDSIFMAIDNQRVNGQGAQVNTLECVYTGTLATGYADRLDAQTTNNFNTEHTWPQSFYSGALPMYTDLHHLFPTTASSNSERANKPFGPVGSPTWQVGGSRSDATTFEPRDVHKGTVSRAMLYFLARYPNYGNFVSPADEVVLRQWAAQFPPSAVDSSRNVAIHSIQGNRNPFVDVPYLLERISSFSDTSHPATPDTSVIFYPDSLMVSGLGKYWDPEIHLLIANTGSVTLQVDFPTLQAAFDNMVDSIAHQQPILVGESLDYGNMTVAGPGDSILPGSHRYVLFRIVQNTWLGSDSITGSLPLIFLEIPTDTHWVHFNAVPGRNYLVGVNPGREMVAPNLYPNPGSGVGILKADFPIYGRVEIRSMLGGLVGVVRVAGNSEVLLDISGQPSGIYLVTVHTDNGRVWNSLLVKQ